MWHCLARNPAAGEFYESVKPIKTYPLRYFQTRWCKHKRVPNKIAEHLFITSCCTVIWLYITLYVKLYLCMYYCIHLTSLPKSKLLQNENKSFAGLLSVVAEPFMNTKFKSVDLIS